MFTKPYSRFYTVVIKVLPPPYVVTLIPKEVAEHSVLYFYHLLLVELETEQGK